MLHKRPLEPFARRWWIDQRIEKDSPIPVGQNERFVLRDRPAGSACQGGHAEIGQLAPLELRRPFDQRLGRFVDTKAEPFFPKPSVDLSWDYHDHLLPYVYVERTNFARRDLNLVEIRV
jgi:hypothetical protein